MVTYKIYTFVHHNIDYHHREHFFVTEWNDSPFKYKGRGQGQFFLNCSSTKYILNGGEILVNCKFTVHKHLNLNLYRKVPRNSNPIKISIRL